MTSKFVGIHHVQLAMPVGEEAAARDFYHGLLGIPELPKPDHLSPRGGCWFETEGVTIHLGVDPNFVPAQKAHPGLLVSGLSDIVARLDDARVDIVVDQPFEGFDRVYVADPFGNRIELLEPLTET